MAMCRLRPYFAHSHLTRNWEPFLNAHPAATQKIKALVSLFLKKALPEHCYYYSALSSSYYQNIVPCQCCKQPSLSGFWTDDALFTIFCATGNLSDWWNVVHFTCRKSFLLLLQLLLHSLCSSYYTTTSSSSEWCTRCFVLKVLITFPHSFFHFLWCLYCFS